MINRGHSVYQEIGWVFCDRSINLSAGHAYEVRFNENTKNPGLEKVCGEVVAVDADVVDLDETREKDDGNEG